MKQFEISTTNEGQRLDKYLHRILSKAPMSFIYKMLRKKNFTLNNKKADGTEILKSGDVIKIFLADDTFEKFIGVSDTSQTGDVKKFASWIIYEDSNLLLINKPDGVLSQKANDSDISLNEYILDYLTNTGNLNSDDLLNYKPSVINRLDRNTSGIVIAAKNLKTASILSEGLKNRTIQKYYKCIVKGRFDKEGIYKGYLYKDTKSNTVSIKDKNDGKSDYIETGYSVLNVMDDVSELEVHLLTGKSHQIRAHLSYLGYPILGDMKYGDASFNKMKKVKHQMLHSYKVVFPIYEDLLLSNISGKEFICDKKFL